VRIDRKLTTKCWVGFIDWSGLLLWPKRERKTDDHQNKES